MLLQFLQFYDAEPYSFIFLLNTQENLHVICHSYHFFFLLIYRRFRISKWKKDCNLGGFQFEAVIEVKEYITKRIVKVWYHASDCEWAEWRGERAFVLTQCHQARLQLLWAPRKKIAVGAPKYNYNTLHDFISNRCPRKKSRLSPPVSSPGRHTCPYGI